MIEIIPNWHPIFVHFTVTLITLAGIVQCIIWVKKPYEGHPVWFVQRWINILGIIAVLLTALTGYFAYNSVEHDTLSHLAMQDHRNWAIATLVAFTIGAILSLLFGKKYIVVTGVLLVISWGLVSITGFKGGELVYRYGLGVISLPNADGAGHSHGDDHMQDNDDDHHQTDTAMLETSEPHHDNDDGHHQTDTAMLETSDHHHDTDDGHHQTDAAMLETSDHHHDNDDGHHH